MITRVMRFAALSAVTVATALSASFVNGNFESGNATGWTVGGGYRGGISNPDLHPADFLPGGVNYDASVASSHSSIVTPGLDPNTSNNLNRVYSGGYSWRVEDTTSGGYASVISQTVQGYSDPDIFFAWAAVLEGAHGPTDAATFQIVLTDLTVGDTLLSREYNAGSTGSGVDARFTYDASTNYYYTHWQVEQLTLPAGRMGHDFTLSVLASDCEPTGHVGYAYLDGFGSVNPPPVSGVPEPASIALMGAGLALGLFKLRRPSAN